MKVECLDARTLSEHDARSIAELVARIWPKPGRTVEVRMEQLIANGRDYVGADAQAPRNFVVRQDGHVVSHATYVTRTIGTSQGELTVAGLARVCSDPDIRGKGLGRLVVEPIFRLVDEGNFSFSVFQTSPEVRPFYERLGCSVVENRIVNSLGEDPQECPFWDNVVMRYPSGPTWPEGEIDLRGPGY